MRSYLGKGLKELRDDAAVLLGIIRDAKEIRPADPLAWITGALKERAVPKKTWDDKLLEASGLAGYVPAVEPLTVDHQRKNLRMCQSAFKRDPRSACKKDPWVMLDGLV